MGLQKCYFWHICDNWPNLLKDSSQTKGQIKNKKLILESPNLLLLEKIKIFEFESHRTSWGHFKVWAKNVKICSIWDSYSKLT